MLTTGKDLQATFTECRTAPINDKDVDSLIEYLTKSYAVDNSDNDDFGQSSDHPAHDDRRDQSSEESAAADKNECKSSFSPPTGEEWEIFQKVALQALSLCLDIYPNNGVLSDTQKKKIVFHGLLQLGSTPLTFREGLPQDSDNGGKNSDHNIPDRRGLDPGSQRNSNISSSRILMKLLKDALEVILSTALLTSENNSVNNNDTSERSKNTTIGIEMLLTPYLSRLQQTHISIQQYLIRICNSKLNPMNAAALINSIISLLSSSSPVQMSMSNKQNRLISNEMIASFFTNLFQCLYNLGNQDAFDSIPPLIYQICQLIDNNNDHATYILTSIVTFLESLLNNSTIIKDSSPSSSHDVTNEKHDECGKNSGGSNNHKKNQEIQWTIFTSLNHLGNVLRGNPLLPNVLLNVLKGKGMKDKSSAETDLEAPDEKRSLPPFLYLRMTPILLATGLTMATYIPRMKDSTLECIRDLVYEESLMQAKRSKSDWFNACAAILLSSQDLKVDDDGQFDLQNRMDDKQKEWENSLQKEVEKYQNHYDCVNEISSSHMLSCLKNVLIMTAGIRDSGKNQKSRCNDAQTNSDLYPALMSLGFLLIDSVQKDIDVPCSNIVQKVPSCADSMNKNSNSSIQKDAQSATARVGRGLLKNLFFYAGMKCEDDDVVIGKSGYISHATLNPLCRSIVMTMFEKFCSMAPNAIEHSYLLRDIAFAEFDEDSIKDVFEGVMESVHLEEYVGASILEESFLSNMIDSLSNVPGCGMPPAVAMVSIIPSLRHILHIAIKKERRNGRYCNQLDAHFDHCFLLAKKCLFCTDVERRKVAVQLLVMIIDLALARRKACANPLFDQSSSSLVDEAVGYLHRCMTQYQSDVRLEVYSSLVSIVPKLDETDGEASQPDSPDTVTSMSVVSQILLNHLERYINVEEDKKIIQARRKRAIQLGTHLSQQVEETNDEPTMDSAPLRLNMCTRQSLRMTSQARFNINQGVKKSTGIDSFVNDVTNCIMEPISFLIASTIAVTREAKKHNFLQEPTEALLKTLRDLRHRVSESTVDQYLKFNDLSSRDNSKSAKIVSTCILIASVAESLMGIPNIQDNHELMDLETIEKLFILRSEAVLKASTILTNQMMKPKNPKKEKTRGSRKITPVGEANEDNDDHDIRVATKIKPQTRSKARKIVENAISSLCPSNPPLLFSKCLRECGVLSLEKDPNDRLELDHDDGEKENQSVEIKLSANAEFRRFLLVKTESLLEGRSYVMRTGENICDIGKDSIGLYYIMCALQLGPICLVEFCSHVCRRKLTSLTNQDDSPLAQVALQAFIYSIQRMTAYVKGHNMSKIQRLSTLLRSSIDALCLQFPNIKSRFDLLRKQSHVLAYNQKSDIEESVITMILPFIVPIRQKPEISCCGLLSELIQSGLDGEATLCYNMLTCIIIHLNPNLRQALGLVMLKCFETCDPGNAKEGVFGLQHDCSLSSNGNCGKSATKAIDSVLYLGGQLDGMTDLIRLKSSQSNVRLLSGFARLSKSFCEKLYDHKIPCEYVKDDSEEQYGIPVFLAMSFLASSGVHHDFDERHLDTLDKFSLRCTEVISTNSAIGRDSVSKDIVSVSNTISNMIESALVDAEFVASKILSVASEIPLTVVRELLASRLIAICMAISSYAPGSDYFDNQSSFTAFLLKCTKRVHVIVSKLVSSYSACKSSNFVLAQSKALLQLWSGKLNKRTMALLLILQGQHRTKDGRVLADSKIKAQGRIAAQVVFEKEKTDSIIFNLSSKLKAKGINSDFLKEKIVVSTHRDFRIKLHEMQAVKTRPNTSNKRKRKSPLKKFKKKAKKDEEDSEHNDSFGNSDDEESKSEEKSLSEDQPVKNDEENEEIGDDDQSQSTDGTVDESDDDELEFDE